MHIADKADRRARILAAMTPDGVSLQDLVPVAEMCRENCGALLRQMAQAGMIWRARGRKEGDEDHHVYYFSTEQARDAWLASYAEVKKNRKRIQCRKDRQRYVDPAIAAHIKANKERRKRLAEKRAQEKAAKQAARAARLAAKTEAAAEARRAKAAERERIKAAKSIVARMPGRKQIDTAQMLYRIRSQEVRAANEKRSGRDDRPVVIPDHVKPQVIKTQPGRFEVVGEITGGFGSLKPGQYAFEANSCAARAAA